MNRISWRFTVINRNCIRRYSSNHFGSNPIKTGQGIDDNRVDLEIYHRLRKVYNCFGGNTRFKYSAYKCTKIYEPLKANLFEDLFTYPRINNDMIKLLMENYRTSSSIRTLVLNDIRNSLLKGKISLPLLLFEKLKNRGQLYGTLNSNTIHGMVNFLITEAALSGEPMLAASYTIQFHRGGFTIEQTVLANLFHALAVDSEVVYLYQCFTIQRLVDIFGVDWFSVKEIELIGNYLLKSWYFSYKMYQLFEKQGLLLKLSPELYKSYRFNLIKLSLDNGNSEKAWKIWQETNIFPITTSDIPVLELIFKSNPTRTNEILLGDFPYTILTSPSIRDILIKHYGTSPDSSANFDSFVKLLTPPLQRLTLSLLFQSFLYQDNEQASESVLQSIFNSKNGISNEEFGAIIVKLLNQGKIDQCLGMVKTTDVNVGKLAYIDIFAKMLQTKQMDQTFLKDLLRKFMKLRKGLDNSFALLTQKLISHFSHNINNRLAKKAYVTIVNQSNKPEFDTSSASLNLEQFDIPHQFQRLFLLTNLPIQVEIVQGILLQALKEQDNSTLQWGIEELRYLGHELAQVLTFLKQNDEDGYLNDIFHEDILMQID